jgi:HNH endonuclease
MGYPRLPLEVRFWTKVDRGGPDNCWPWLAAAASGYGVIGAGGKRGALLLAHRVAYEICIGPIPVGLVIDHLCENSLCVNPGHLEPVTQSTNIQRGVHGRRTMCLHGHTLDGVRRNRQADGAAYLSRYCKACARERYRVRKAAA